MGFFNFGKQSKREKPTEAPSGEKSVSTGSRIVTVRGLAEAERVGAAYHAMRLRADALAVSKLSFERYNAAGRVWTKWAEGPHSGQWRRLNWLMQVKPNRWQNATQMWQLLSWLSDGLGNAGLYLRRGFDGGEVLEIEPCTFMSVYQTGTEVRYIVQPVFSGSSFETDPENVILFNQPVSVRSSIHSAALVDVARAALTRFATASGLVLSMAGKGNQKRFIVKQDTGNGGYSGMNGYNDDEVKKGVENMNEQYRTDADFIFDEFATQLTEISQSFQDVVSPTLLVRAQEIEEIGRCFGVPGPLMFAQTNSVYKSTDDAWKLFQNVTVEPRLMELEDEFDSKILTEAEYDMFRFHFERHALCLEGDKAKAETRKIYVDAGIMSADEVREELNLPKGAPQRPAPAPVANNTQK